MTAVGLEHGRPPTWRGVSGSGLTIVGADLPAADAGPNLSRPSGIPARSIDELAVGMPCPAGLDSAYRRGMPSAATAVQLNDEGDGRVEMRLELLGQPEPANGLRQWGSMHKSLRLAVITRPTHRRSGGSARDRQSYAELVYA
jgi:hypothetical protein